MAPFATLSREEKTGLVVAGAAHAAILVALMVQVGSERDFTPPQRIDVSLATDVSLESTAPDPSDQPAAAMAPELSDLPSQESTPLETVVPEPVTQPTTAPPRPAPSPRTQRVAQPTPTPTPRATQTQAPRPQPTQTQRATGSRLNDNFLEGMSDSTGTQGQAGERPSAQQQASIDAAIIRQLKPHWTPPSGVEVERLVTRVRFRLNRDGSLNGTPEVLATTGETDANRTQVNRHREQAIRAVRLASPFNLPERFYSGWSTVTVNFNNELAQ
ncbi:TonB C-terminal domain-containing protein [Alteraurantiacibacter aquimixticola]|uniref:Energy transducer TonB n=1 Tax=Alteraurantiacibacter aquimixticola TaxID=2489173 RepID=A0A4T3F0R2_9SPHN|nr:TonB C-terminal domain-containing protein [Alteraurantiacibacter aquimixticola]TIX49782.1 energy transducer TonB [Alteraurantiacibacter aquimixticola]